jgi:hypothetical protein
MRLTIIGVLCLLLLMGVVLFSNQDKLWDNVGMGDNTVKKESWIKGDYKVIYKSSNNSGAQVVDDSGRCLYYIKAPYAKPTIDITSLQSGFHETYELVPKSNSRAFIDTAIRSQQAEVDMIYIGLINYDKNCNESKYRGILLFNRKGELSSLKLPVSKGLTDLKIIRKSDLEEFDIDLIPTSYTLEANDYNRDQRSNFLIIEPKDQQTHLWTLTMIDVPSNSLASWFNQGKPLQTSANYREMTFDTAKEFIKQFSDPTHYNE